jgi:hypothetical protein
VTHDEMIAVIQHHKDGGKIEYITHDNDQWEMIITNPLWNFATNDYRIKPESAEQPSGEGLSSNALFSSLFHPNDSDRGFLMWIHERLEHVHDESRLSDYMHKLRAIIADMPADRRTISVGQGKNSLESLQEFIVEGSAFPLHLYGDYGKGMTLRDYFAAATLQGLLAKYGNAVEEESYETIVQASTCYEYADAMIEARKGDA